MRGAKLSFWHPMSLVATCFGIGKIPFAPGTWGSLLALPIFVGFALCIESYIPDFFVLMASLVGMVFFLFVIGSWAAHYYAIEVERSDPREIVIDEVTGQALTTLLTYPGAIVLAADLYLSDLILGFFLVGGFVAFRICDIIKPWPVGWCDRNISGGIGIMLDDILAAIVASLLFYGFLMLALDIGVIPGMTEPVGGE